MRTVAVTLAAGLFSALAFPAGAQSVKLTIWNLGNLHYETGVGTPGRPFALPRSDEDYNVLKEVAASAPSPPTSIRCRRSTAPRPSQGCST
jgi:hypothetical protein